MAAADLARHGLTGPPTVLEGRFGFLHAFPAVLRVTTRTGEELEARVEVNRGGPGNPLSDEELARKFHDNAVRSLPEERAAELAARTLALPDAQSVEDLTALLISAGER